MYGSVYGGNIVVGVWQCPYLRRSIPPLPGLQRHQAQIGGECVAGWAWEGKLHLEIEAILDDSCGGKKAIYRALLFMIKQGFAVRIVSCYA